MQIAGIHRDGNRFSVELENGEMLEGISSGEISQDVTRDHLRLELSIVVPMEAVASHVRPEDGYIRFMSNFPQRHENGFFDSAVGVTAAPPEINREITPDEFRRAYEGAPVSSVPEREVITVHNMIEDQNTSVVHLEWRALMAEREQRQSRMERQIIEGSMFNIPLGELRGNRVSATIMDETVPVEAMADAGRGEVLYIDGERV